MLTVLLFIIVFGVFYIIFGIGQILIKIEIIDRKLNDTNMLCQNITPNKLADNLDDSEDSADWWKK